MQSLIVAFSLLSLRFSSVHFLTPVFVFPPLLSFSLHFLLLLFRLVLLFLHPSSVLLLGSCRSQRFLDTRAPFVFLFDCESQWEMRQMTVEVTQMVAEFLLNA